MRRPVWPFCVNVGSFSHSAWNTEPSYVQSSAVTPCRPSAQLATSWLFVCVAAKVSAVQIQQVSPASSNALSSSGAAAIFTVPSATLSVPPKRFMLLRMSWPAPVFFSVPSPETGASTVTVPDAACHVLSVSAGGISICAAIRCPSLKFIVPPETLMR